MKCSKCGSEKVVENVTPEIALFCKTCGNIVKPHIHTFYPIKLHYLGGKQAMFICECGAVKFVKVKE